MTTKLKPGYKQTEVGVIPEEWEVKPLGTISEKIMVGIASAATHAYREKGVPMFRNQNIKNGHLDDSDVLFIDPKYEVTYKNKRLRSGDLLTMRTGYPGVTAIVPPTYDAAQSFTTLISRPNQQQAESTYLCHYINSAQGQLFFTQSQIGGAQKNVNAGTLRGMPVPLPKISEQRAIAEALSDVDELIGALEKLVAKKRDIKQATMQQLLTAKTRLPGFTGKWEETKLAKFGKCHRGVSYEPSIDLSPFDTESTVRLLRSNNVQEAKVVFTDLQYVDSGRVSDDQYLRTNDILICMANGSRELVGKSGLFFIEDGLEYTFGAFMGCFRPDCKATNPNFVFYLLQTEKYRTHISILLAGSSINNLMPSSVESLKINVPLDKDEQTAIAEVLSDMDAEIEGLEQRLEKTRLLKQGMMQELLTGRIRLI